MINTSALKVGEVYDDLCIWTINHVSLHWSRTFKFKSCPDFVASQTLLINITKQTTPLSTIRDTFFSYQLLGNLHYLFLVICFSDSNCQLVINPRLKIEQQVRKQCSPLSYTHSAIESTRCNLNYYSTNK